MTSLVLTTDDLTHIHTELDRRYSSGDVRIIDVQLFDDRWGPTPVLRVRYDIRGIAEDYRNVEIGLDFLLGTRMDSPNLIGYIIRELIRSIEEDRREVMAQWNQRRTQQLQAQERQRREARGQTTAEAAVEWAEIEPQPQRFVDIRNGDFIGDQPRWMTDRLNNQIPYNDTVRGSVGGTTTINTTIAGSGFMYNSTNSIGGVGGAGSSYVSGNTLTFDAAEEMCKRLLQEKLESLDIRISLDESDGEVTAEVEVILDGKVITSDSDTITIG